jgi:hypothetical protein
MQTCGHAGTDKAEEVRLRSKGPPVPYNEGFKNPVTHEQSVIQGGQTRFVSGLKVAIEPENGRRIHDKKSSFWQ